MIYLRNVLNTFARIVWVRLEFCLCMCIFVLYFPVVIFEKLFLDYMDCFVKDLP